MAQLQAGQQGENGGNGSGDGSGEPSVDEAEPTGAAGETPQG